MSIDADVVLAATLHDPTGALFGSLCRALPALRRRYRAVAVATSPPTAVRIVRALRDVGMHAGTPRANLRGPLYRLALRAACARGTARVHYVDFDRAIHWLAVAPAELDALLAMECGPEPLWIGRTPRAYASHHRPLVATEAVVSGLLARRLGLPGRVDFLVPSFLIDGPTARALAAWSRARDGAVYGELVALLGAGSSTVSYIECRGLDWETPDRRATEIRRVGFAAWRRAQDTPEEWCRRVALARSIVRGFDRTRARYPAGPLTVRRLVVPG